MKKFTKFIAMMTALLMVFGCFTACSNTKTKDDEKSSKKSSRDKDDDDDDDDDDDKKDKKKDKDKDKDEDESVEGTYISEVDMTEYFQNELLGGAPVSGSVSIPLVLTLENDGTYTMSMDANEYIEQSKIFITENIDSVLQATMGMSLSELSEAYGMSEQEIIDMFTSGMDEGMASEDMDDFSTTGTYTVDGSTIELSGDNNTLKGSLSKGTISIDIEANGGSTDDFTSLFPDGTMTFVKQ